MNLYTRRRKQIKNLFIEKEENWNAAVQTYSKVVVGKASHVIFGITQRQIQGNKHVDYFTGVRQMLEKSNYI